MKFIKLYESFEDIDFICRKYSIENYTINSDGTVDIDDRQVNLFNRRLTKLPLKFGKVSGNFSCSNNLLTSLEFSPQSLGGSFYCQCNQLTSLEFSPQSVGDCFSFSENKLKDLYGFPEFYDGEVYYDSNPVSEILDLFGTKRLGKVIHLIYITMIKKFETFNENSEEIEYIKDIYSELEGFSIDFSPYFDSLDVKINKTSKLYYDDSDNIDWKKYRQETFKIDDIINVLETSKKYIDCTDGSIDSIWVHIYKSRLKGYSKTIYYDELIILKEKDINSISIKYIFNKSW